MTLYFSLDLPHTATKFSLLQHKQQTAAIALQYLGEKQKTKSNTFHAVRTECKI